MPRSPMQAIFPDRVDTLTGVRGGMGLPSEELPSETPNDATEKGLDKGAALERVAARQTLDKSSALGSVTA